MLLLIGATGMFGGRIAALLSDAGVPFRAVLRRADDAGELANQSGVEIIEGDLDDPPSLRAAFDGVDTVFLNAPMDDKKEARLKGAIEVARATSKPRVVLLTGGVQHDDPLGKAGAAAQDALEASGLAWTLVGPQTVMESNLLPQADSIKSGTIIGCAGDGRIGMVALDDVAEAFVAALTTSGHEGREYIITGPAAITFAEVAEAATRVLGHPVTYQDMADDDYRSLLIQLGVFTEENIDIGIMWHMQAMRAGKAARVTDDFTTLTGRPSRSIDDFFAQHRSTFS